MRRSLTLILTLALVASACGSEPQDLIVGDDVIEAGVEDAAADASESAAETVGVTDDGASTSRDSTGAVADDSPPRFDDFCAIGDRNGPLDPTEVLVTALGGRWGDQERGVDSGRAETGFETPVEERPECQVDEVTSDCLTLTAFIGEVGAGARVTARDDETAHDLDVSAASVGAEADAYASAINDLGSTCPSVSYGPETIEFSSLESPTVEGVEARADGERVWLTALARENVVVLVIVAQTGDVPLRDPDLADFERVVELSRVKLDAAPIG